MKIVLDPGHGGVDPGGRSVGEAEKWLNLQFQPFLWKALSDMGHCCLTTRIRDESVALAERSDFANVRSADLFLSIHYNASSDPAVRGAWTLYAAPSAGGRRLAQMIQEALAVVDPRSHPDRYLPDGSDWTGGRRLHVLRRTSMTAIVLELGFMTSVDDYRAFTDDRRRVRQAEAIAMVIGQWSRV